MRRAPIFLLIFSLAACARRDLETIVVKGSDTEVNLVLQLAEAFMDTDPAVSVSVTGGGSGVGIAALLNGRATVANSSRELNAHELALAAERQVAIEPFAFAADALAVICHPSVPLDSLCLADLGRIFSGQTASWQPSGQPVSLYGRQSNSGTFMYFRERVLGRDYAPALKQMNGNAQILEAVRADPNAIGFIGFGYLTNESGALRAGIKVVRLAAERGQAAVSPLDRAAVGAGLYPLTRPLFQFTDGAPTGKLRAFFEFEKSAAGQAIIAKNGYLTAADAGLASNLNR